MSDPYIWLAILAITFASLLTRAAPHLLDTRLKLPPTVESALRFAPACALAAIIAPDLVYVGSDLMLSSTNPRLLGGIAATVIFATSRSMIATIFGGMAVFWLARAMFGG